MSNGLETLYIKRNHWELIFYLYRKRLRPFNIQDMLYDYNNNDKYRQRKENKLHEKICTKNLQENDVPAN